MKSTASETSCMLGGTELELSRHQGEAEAKQTAACEPTDSKHF